jgi:dimethylglycine dehydrogenase
MTEVHDEDLLRRAVRPEMTVSITNVTMCRGCFVIAGPHSRDLLAELTDTALSNEAFPWFGLRECEVGWATGVRVLRVNYLGELGYELHHPIAFQHHLLEQLLRAGAVYRLRHIGFRALNSLRLEKSYRAIKAELTAEDTLDEAGLGRFARPEKGDFMGRAAVLAERKKPIRRTLVTLAVECADSGVEPAANQPIYAGDKAVARSLSGAFGHHVGTGLALVYLPPELAEPGTALQLAMLGTKYPARVVPDSPHDPKNLRPRALDPCRGADAGAAGHHQAASLLSTS